MSSCCPKLVVLCFLELSRLIMLSICSSFSLMTDRPAHSNNYCYVGSNNSGVCMKLLYRTGKLRFSSAISHDFENNLTKEKAHLNFSWFLKIKDKNMMLQTIFLLLFRKVFTFLILWLSQTYFVFFLFFLQIMSRSPSVSICNICLHFYRTAIESTSTLRGLLKH